MATTLYHCTKENEFDDCVVGLLFASYKPSNTVHNAGEVYASNSKQLLECVKDISVTNTPNKQSSVST